MSETQCAVHDAVTGSIDEENSKEPDKKVKSRRPANTAFRQQRLKAWQPILTPKTVLPLLFAVGVIFAPIGGLLLYASSQVQEIVIDYTDCIKAAPSAESNNSFTGDNKFFIPSDKYYSYFKSSTDSGAVPTWLWSNQTALYDDSIKIPTCSVQFQIPDKLKAPVFFYYRLTDFFQNHRRYVKSLDTNQLAGTAISASTISGGSCDPLRLDPNGKPYYPCGLIANSVFNDTFSQPLGLSVANASASNITYPMTTKGIAWSSDAKLYGKTQYKPEDVAVPPNWVKRFPNATYTAENIPNLNTNEAFQVWMRTAGLPTFDKLAMRNDDDEMEPGRYQVDIQMNFDVSAYGGTKSIVISTTTVMGGRNPFLGIAYIVVAGICVVLGIVFTIANFIRPRKLGDHQYLTWNNDQPSTGTSTGVSRPGNDTA